MKRAASNPAPCFLVTSDVSRYAAIAVKEAKIGAMKTHILRISTGIASLCKKI